MRKIFILIVLLSTILTGCENKNKAIQDAIDNGDYEIAEKKIRDKLELDTNNLENWELLAEVIQSEYLPTYNVTEFLTPVTSSWDIFPYEKFKRTSDLEEAISKLKTDGYIEKYVRHLYFLLCHSFYRAKYFNENEYKADLEKYITELMGLSHELSDNVLFWKYYIDSDFKLNFDIGKLLKEVQKYPDSELIAIKQHKAIYDSEITGLEIADNVLSEYNEFRKAKDFEVLVDSLFINYQIKPRLSDEFRSRYDDKELIAFLDKVIDKMLNKSINYYCIWEKGKILIENDDFESGKRLMESIIDKVYNKYGREKYRKTLAGIAFDHGKYSTTVSHYRQVEVLTIEEEMELWQSLIEIGYEEEADELYDKLEKVVSPQQKAELAKIQYNYDLSKLILDEVNYMTSSNRIGISGILKNPTYKTYRGITVGFTIRAEDGNKLTKRMKIQVMYPESEKSLNELIDNSQQLVPESSEGRILSFEKAE